MFIINGVRWRIKLVSPSSPALLKSDGSLSIGVCDDFNKTIYINNQLKVSKLKKVLCHEITHAAMFSYHINLSLD